MDSQQLNNNNNNNNDNNNNNNNNHNNNNKSRLKRVFTPDLEAINAGTRPISDWLCDDDEVSDPEVVFVEYPKSGPVLGKRGPFPAVESDSGVKVPKLGFIQCKCVFCTQKREPTDDERALYAHIENCRESLYHSMVSGSNALKAHDELLSSLDRLTGSHNMLVSVHAEIMKEKQLVMNANQALVLRCEKLEDEKEVLRQENKRLRDVKTVDTLKEKVVFYEDQIAALKKELESAAVRESKLNNTVSNIEFLAAKKPALQEVPNCLGCAQKTRRINIQKNNIRDLEHSLRKRLSNLDESNALVHRFKEFYNTRVANFCWQLIDDLKNDSAEITPHWNALCEDVSGELENLCNDCMELTCLI
jgi:DNA repair exonuclease SbcCD ATPase subunit